MRMRVVARFRGYRPDNASMARFLLSGRVGDAAEGVAEKVADGARANAAPHTKSGTYLSRFVTEGFTHPGDGLEGGPRRAALVGNVAPYASILELGPTDKSRRGYRFITRAAAPYHVPRGAIRRGGS